MRPLLLSSPSLLSALYCLGLAIFVISRNPKHKVNYSFALGMMALALMEFGYFMGLNNSLTASYLFGKKASGLWGNSLPGPWLVFSLTFGRSNPSQYLSRWRLGIIAAHLLSLSFMVARIRLVPDRGPHAKGAGFALCFSVAHAHRGSGQFRSNTEIGKPRAALGKIVRIRVILLIFPVFARFCYNLLDYLASSSVTVLPLSIFIFLFCRWREGSFFFWKFKHFYISSTVLIKLSAKYQDES